MTIDIPKIQIQTTKAQLQLQTTPPVQRIEQPKATMTIQQPAATLEISTTKSSISIDTTEARAEVDRKSIRRRIAEHAQMGHQKVQEGTKRRAREGDQLMRIEHGGNAIQQIVKQNQPRPYRSLGIGFVGNKSGVQVEGHPGTTNIQITPEKPSIQAQVQKPVHQYTRGKVSGHVNPKPSIQIDVKR